MTIAGEVAAAFRFAREQAKMTTEEFAAALNQISGESALDSQQVRSIEAGELIPMAAELVAAARVANLTTSEILGEMQPFSARLTRLETLLVKHGVIPDE